MRLKIALIAAAFLLTACVNGGGATNCAGWKPIRLDAASIDGLTERDARDILAHNEFGAQRCGW